MAVGWNRLQEDEVTSEFEDGIAKVVGGVLGEFLNEDGEELDLKDLEYLGLFQRQDPGKGRQ